LIIFGVIDLASMSKAKDRITRSFFMLNCTRNHLHLFRVLLLSLLLKNKRDRSSFGRADRGPIS
jgi:hypothetical protein